MEWLPLFRLRDGGAEIYLDNHCEERWRNHPQ
jgi:hypothetical protein